MQWGYSIASGGTFTYPLSLSALYGYFIQLNATSSAERALIKEISPSSVSTTKLVMNTNTSNIKSNVFIIGKQKCSGDITLTMQQEQQLVSL